MSLFRKKSILYNPSRVGLIWSYQLIFADYSDDGESDDDDDNEDGKDANQTQREGKLDNVMADFMAVCFIPTPLFLCYYDGRSLNRTFEVSNDWKKG